MTNKRGYYYSTDALIAVVVIFLVIFALKPLGEKREIKKMSKMDDDDKDKNKSILFINKSLAQKDSCLKGYF